MLDYITGYFGSNVTPGEAGNWFWATAYILIIFGAVSLAVNVMVWAERKVLAHIQVRIGPMRVGPHGLLQPIADALKLLIKEDIMPAQADRLVFWMAPIVMVMTAFTIYIVIPFGPTYAVTDMNIGLLFMLGVASLGVVAVIMAGWASNSAYPLLGALRSSAQMVSYEVALGLTVISAIIMTSLHEGTGTLSMIGIVRAQEAQAVWFAFKFFPLGLAAFIIFAIAMVAETNRAPFDLPEAESELVAGFHTEYSGFRWSLFFLAEYAGMIAISSIAVTLWLGGWLRPFPNWLGGESWDIAFALMPAAAFLLLAVLSLRAVMRMPKHPLLRIQRLGLAAFGLLLLGLAAILLLPPVRDAAGPVFWFVAKVSVFMYLYIWYRGTFPRYRFDQLMRVGWKVLLPASLVVLILTGVVGVREELMAWVRGLG